MSSTGPVTSQEATKPKKVCMIAYTNYRFDGRVRLEAESLVRWGYEVVFLVPKQEAAPKTYVLEGVTIKELNTPKIRDKNKIRYVVSYLSFLVAAFFACTRMFFKHRFEVVHVHNMPNFLVFAALIPRMLGCKLVLDLHDTVLETYEAKFEKPSRVVMGVLRWDERICCGLATHVICVNHVQREAVIARGVPGEKIATVITMPRYAALPELPTASEARQSFRLVNHGTMSKRLGNDLILRATVKLVEQIPGFELHIIGGGDSLPEMHALTEELGIGECVHFHAGVPWDQLAEKLRSMDVGIVANRVNIATQLMLPSKLIDYSVLGIPAIVPRLKAIQYYFSDDMVTYFEPENVDSMVAAVVSLYRNAGRREQQAKNARKFVHDNAWEGSNSKLRLLYESFNQKKSLREDRKLAMAQDQAAAEDGVRS